MVVAAVIGMTLLAIGTVTFVSHRRMRGLQASIEALRTDTRATVDELATNQSKLDARQDRLQKMVQDRGWKDSMLLTRFDWRKPSDRG